jgi:hypothetical protein
MKPSAVEFTLRLHKQQGEEYQKDNNIVPFDAKFIGLLCFEIVRS